MRFQGIHHPIPWAVAETICDMIVRTAPPSLYVIGDPDGRLGYAVETLFADRETAWNCNYIDALVDEIPEGTHTLVWISDEQATREQCLIELADLAGFCVDTVICAEPLSQDRGLGIRSLREFDRHLSQVVSDEIPDGNGDLRERHPQEPAVHWAVARCASWRFREGAELDRSEFLYRIGDTPVTRMYDACVEIQRRWPNSHELLIVAMHCAAEQGALNEASRIFELIRSAQCVSQRQITDLWRVLKAYGLGILRGKPSGVGPEAAANGPLHGGFGQSKMVVN